MLVTELVSLVTPQVVLAILGGLVGSVYGVIKSENGIILSIILVIIGVMASAAAGDYLFHKHEIVSPFFIGALCIPVGLISGFLIEALEAVSPDLAAKTVKKLGGKTINKL